MTYKQRVQQYRDTLEALIYGRDGRAAPWDLSELAEEWYSRAELGIKQMFLETRLGDDTESGEHLRIHFECDGPSAMKDTFWLAIIHTLSARGLGVVTSNLLADQGFGDWCINLEYPPGPKQEPGAAFITDPLTGALGIVCRDVEEGWFQQTAADSQAERPWALDDLVEWDAVGNRTAGTGVIVSAPEGYDQDILHIDARSGDLTGVRWAAPLYPSEKWRRVEARPVPTLRPSLGAEVLSALSRRPGRRVCALHAAALNELVAQHNAALGTPPGKPDIEVGFPRVEQDGDVVYPALLRIPATGAVLELHPGEGGKISLLHAATWIVTHEAVLKQALANQGVTVPVAVPPAGMSGRDWELEGREMLQRNAVERAAEAK